MASADPVPEDAHDAELDEPGSSEPSDEPEPSDSDRETTPAVNDAAPSDEPAPRDSPAMPDSKPVDTTPRCTGSEVVTSQAYLDAFFKGCKTIGDSVYIDANAVDNLDALAEVETIAGELVIGPGVASPLSENLAPDTSQVRLKSLAGLAKLQRVQQLVVRQLPITDLRGLGQLRWGSVTLAGLSSLESLTGLGEGVDGARIELMHLPVLKDLTGLRGAILDAVIIRDCAALRELSGATLTRAGLIISDAPSLLTLSGVAASSLRISNAPLLRDLAAVRGRTSVGGLILKGLPSLRSLTDLTGVKSLSALLLEDCDGLENLEGLELVESYEVFSISECSNLRSLAGLDGLTSVYYGLALKRLPALQSLQGLSQLVRAEALILEDLPGLSDLTGPESLIRLGTLHLEGAGPKTLHGLASLHSVGTFSAARTSLESLDGLTLGQLWSVELKDNPKLARIDSLRSVTIGTSLTLEGNPALVDLAGLENIPEMANLTLLNNSALRDLRALSGVQRVTQARILGNVQLPQCEILWLAGRASFEPQSIESNGPLGACAP